ncbi:MAG: DUF748 domain-containing protein [Thiobacillaceae bacterium]
MPPRLPPWLQRPLLLILGLIAFYLALGCWIAPPLIKWGAERYVAQELGHRLSMDRPQIDPLRFTLRLANLRLDDPDGAPLAGFRELFVDLEADSLWNWAYVLREVRLVAPMVDFELRADGSHNFTRLVEALKDEEEEKENPLPRLWVQGITVQGGRIDFADRSVSPAYTTRIEPLELAVTDLTSLPDRQGRYRFSIRSSQGLALRGEGTLHLEPLRIVGDLSLNDLVLAQFAPYLQPHVRIAPPRGSLALTGRYRVDDAQGRIAVALEGLGLTLEQLGLRGENDAEDTLALQRLALSGGRLNPDQRLIVFDAMTLAGGGGNLRVAADGRLNVQDWFPARPETAADAMPSTAASGVAAPPWRLQLGALKLEGLTLRYDDAAMPLTARVGNLGLSLRAQAEVGAAQTRAEIEGLAMDLTDIGVTARRSPWVALQAMGLRGERIVFSSGGAPPWHIDLQGVSLEGRGVRYTETALARPLVARLGRLTIGFAARAEARAETPDLRLDGLDLDASDVELASAGRGTLLSLAGIALQGGRFDLAGRRFEAQRLALDRGRMQAERDAQGRFPLLEALQPAAPAPGRAGVGKTAGEPRRHWAFGLGRAELNAFQVGLRDTGVDPPVTLTLQSIDVRADNLSQDLKAAIPLKLSLQVKEGGVLQAEGRVVPAAPSADLRLRLSDLTLTSAQPYLSRVANLTLVSGQASSQGRLRYDGEVHYEGALRIADLLINEAGSDNRFLAWKSLATADLKVGNRALEIDELKLDSPAAKLIIYEDKSVNLKRILKTDAVQDAAPVPSEQVAATAEPALAATSGQTPVARTESPVAYPVSIARVSVDRGELDFADLSLALPFAARIHEFKGGINGIASAPGTPAQLELDGRVDEYGLARAAGQIELFDPTRFMDIKVVFRNVEMTKLTPYTATFAGRKIASGKLSLDLEYKISERQLLGENQIVMDQLTLGERVESPTARNLPLDLAIAILKDSKGQIDLGLPVSGSLDDPQFSYGQIIWKAIVNVVTKIVTAPFRALGRLFGSSGEEMESIVFDLGEARLLPPEREKLVKLGHALEQRPNLALSVRGAYHPEADAAVLRDLDLRRAIAQEMGRKLADDEDPGPMATGQPAVRKALEALYARRFGAQALEELQARHRQANPGPPPEGTVGKLLSRVSGLIRAKPEPLPPEEEAALKGVDLHGLVYQRLLQTEAVDEVRLQGLAGRRAEAIAATLRQAGLADARIQIGPPERLEGEQRQIPIRLGVAVAASTETAQPEPAGGAGQP